MNWRSFVPVVLLVAAGCGSGKIAPVSGQVTLDDKPLGGVLVTYQPEGTGGGSTALTDESGNYTLRMVMDDQPGAAIGKHRVEIACPVDASSDKDTGGRAPKPKVVIPPRYNVQSELSMDVPPGGKKDANFALKSR
jgi:hypothetical protein